VQHGVIGYYGSNIYIFYSPEMVATRKKKYERGKQKIHKYQKRKHEKPNDVAAISFTWWKVAARN